MKTLFLTVDEVLAVHADLVGRYGGSHGVRDLAALESALAMPRAGFADTLLHPTLPEQAAAYLFHLCQGHPFLDGNKRVALGAALAFLGLNDHDLAAAPDDVYRLVMGVASGQTSKAETAVFFAKHVRSTRP
jgi:death-on-curing protein